MQQSGDLRSRASRDAADTCLTRRRGYLRGEQRLCSYITELARFNDVRAARLEFEDFAAASRRGLKTSTYNVLIRILTSSRSRQQYVNEAVEIVKEMKASGPSPDSITLPRS